MIRFACAGGCEQSHPIEEGQLVFEVIEPTAKGWLTPSRAPQVAAVILCAACTAQLVADRAGVTA